MYKNTVCINMCVNARASVCVRVCAFERACFYISINSGGAVKVLVESFSMRLSVVPSSYVPVCCQLFELLF